jgi:predicted P-loop ATPase
VLRTAVIERFEFDPGAPLSRAAVIRLCLDNSFNPILDYLTSLEWDGKPRLDTWLVRYVGAADEPLNRAFGRKVLIAAVRRVREPGTKFDQVLVLEGEEGIGKSTVPKILASPDYFCDEKIIGERNREVVELTTGVWIYELNELEGLGEQGEARVKALLSRTHGKARPAYGYVPVERGRTCIFFGTINGTKYLEGNTGNRRFWPVAATKIDLEGLARDRDQLWAEAFGAEARGETLVLDEGLWGVAAERAEERTAHDPWEDAVSVAENLPVVPGQVWRGVNERGENEIRVRSEYIFATLLRLGPASANSSHWRRLAGVMKELGWNEPKNMKIDGVSKATYSKKITPVSPVPAVTASTLETILKEKL